MLCRGDVASEFENGTVGAVVAMAAIDQLKQRFADVAQFGDLGVDLRYMTARQSLYIGAGPAPIPPQRQQIGDILDRESQRAGMRNETQGFHLLGRVDAVAIGAAAG